MSCVLPPEILDLIVDHLHDEPTTLRTCCFVSRSWVPRTRRHLFADIEFGAIVQPPIELWKKAFPDPSNSPAHYTRNLSIYGVTVVTAANAGVGGWIPAFQNIVHLRLERLDRASLIPFYGLSPTIRSLHLTRCTVEVFDLISSFPFLEDLALDDLHPESDADGWSAPVTSPKLTGTLDLCMRDARPVARRLLDLPGGLHFSRINTTFSDDDADSVADLVSRCSDTLEFLNILYWSPYVDIPRTSFLDLCKATKLEYVGFLWNGSTAQWIITTLQTVKSKNLEYISIYQNGTLREVIRGVVHQEWGDLDRLLIQFWSTHSIRPRIVYLAGRGGEDLRDRLPSLLPELTRNGLIDLDIET